MNAFIRAESDEKLGADRYAHTCEGRTDYRNGSRTRDLVTRIRMITLSMLVQLCVPFPIFLAVFIVLWFSRQLDVLRPTVERGTDHRNARCRVRRLRGGLLPPVRVRRGERNERGRGTDESVFEKSYLRKDGRSGRFSLQKGCGRTVGCGRMGLIKSQEGKIKMNSWKNNRLFAAVLLAALFLSLCAFAS